MTRFAAIDVGSNAVRLLISDVAEKENLVDFKKVLFLRVPLRLGLSVFAEDKITKNKAKELIKVISAFKNLIDVYKVDEMMACATAAMREASNGKEIIKKVKSETGVRIELIDGKKEAEIIYTNHIAESLDHQSSYLYIDVGGGSTELTLFSKGTVVSTCSFPIGTIRILYDKVSEDQWSELKSWLKTQASGHKDLIAIGTGGNINKIFKLSGKKEKFLTLPEIKEIQSVLTSLTIDERIEKLGMNEDRADVIVPAGKIFLNIMKWADIEEVHVPRIGLADGIIHYLYEHSKIRALV
jgi:exopolyphosphatase / guanosine-5'-triphosphate,3'-diphosphate pyrophosphatase